MSVSEKYINNHCSEGGEGLFKGFKGAKFIAKKAKETTLKSIGDKIPNWTSSAAKKVKKVKKITSKSLSDKNRKELKIQD